MRKSRFDRGIIIRIKRRKETTRRKLGKGESREPEEEKELPDREEEAAGTMEEETETTEIEEVPEQPEIEPEPSVVEEVHEKEKFVIPGELIGTSEEYIARNGTFVDRGNIYSTVTGNIKTNPKDRSISVNPVTNTPPHLAVGDIVVGQVTDVKDSVALVEIAGIKGKGEREIVNAEQAAIHVSNVKDAYVKELYYEFAPFDIVKAKVLDMGNMRLSTVNKDLGVMKAFCGNCRTVLRKDENKLKCPKCKRTETRKLAQDYGTGII